MQLKSYSSNTPSLLFVQTQEVIFRAHAGSFWSLINNNSVIIKVIVSLQREPAPDLPYGINKEVCQTNGHNHFSTSYHPLIIFQSSAFGDQSRRFLPAISPRLPPVKARSSAVTQTRGCGSSPWGSRSVTCHRWATRTLPQWGHRPGTASATKQSARGQSLACLCRP